LGLSIRLNEPDERLEPSHEGADLEVVDDSAEAVLDGGVALGIEGGGAFERCY